MCFFSVFINELIGLVEYYPFSLRVHRIRPPVGVAIHRRDGRGLTRTLTGQCVWHDNKCKCKKRVAQGNDYYSVSNRFPIPSEDGVAAAKPVFTKRLHFSRTKIAQVLRRPNTAAAKPTKVVEVRRQQTRPVRFGRPPKNHENTRVACFCPTADGQTI